MNPIRVLIIDDNILVRRAVTSILKKHDNIDVLWSTGEAIDVNDIMYQHQPDVVLLSIENMESKGLTLLSNFRSKFPSLPIVVISPRSQGGGEAAITALRLGAVDFVTKPFHKNLILFAERHLEKRLEPLIRAASKMHEHRNLSEEILQSIIHPQKIFEHLTEDKQKQESVELVVIGGCTGGAKSLFTILAALPENLSAPIVIVQHLPRIYTKILAEKLDAVSHLMVREAKNGVSLQDGDVWIAPGGFHSEIAQSGYQHTINTHRGLRENNMRPSIDILFRSAAKVYAEKTLGIILSGCGCDGLAGCEEIKRSGGQIMVQDPQTAIAPELPLSMIRNGLTREYYAPEDLAFQIVKRVEKTEVSAEYLGQDATVGKSVIF